MRLGVVLVTIALPASLLSAAPAAQAQAASCRGLAATIEGAANQSITDSAAAADLELTADEVARLDAD